MIAEVKSRQMGQTARASQSKSIMVPVTEGVRRWYYRQNNTVLRTRRWRLDRREKRLGYSGIFTRRRGRISAPAHSGMGFYAQMLHKLLGA